MKLKIACPKCGSNKVNIVSDSFNSGDPTPLYKCGSCGYKHRLFPQLWKENKKEEKTRPSEAGLGED